jgi:hypothetical protein
MGNRCLLVEAYCSNFFFGDYCPKGRLSLLDGTCGWGWVGILHMCICSLTYARVGMNVSVWNVVPKVCISRDGESYKYRSTHIT